MPVNVMVDNIVRGLRRYIFGLAVLLNLVIAICSFPVQAHIGVSTEIEEVSGQIQNNPKAPHLYLKRGKLHRINGHWPEAIADFNKVQQLNPGNAKADLGLGTTYFDQGRYKKAIQNLDRALAQQPNNVRGLIVRARALRLYGKPLAAAADYKHAISTFKDPKKPSPDFYFERAHAFEAAGTNHIGKALQTLDAGISRLGNLRILEDYAVELEHKRKHYNAALSRLDRIINRSVRKESLLSKRGEILMQANRPTEAHSDFVAASKAIGALPPQRRYTRAMKQLHADIDNRMQSLTQRGGRE